jgi:hemerythrin-like metal-binding protein
MITWREEMAVGVPAIDDDHKALIGIINEFESCQTRTCAERAAKKLYAYTRSHFRREEAIQASFNYPDRERQAAEHAQIAANLETLIKTAFLGKSRSDSDVIADITKLMRQWIVDHVIKHDLKMRPFFRKIQRPEDFFLPPLVSKIGIGPAHHHP